MIGGQVGIGGHLIIGNNVKVLGQTGITKNIKDSEVIYGTPAFKSSSFNRSYVHFKNLPTIVSKINQLEKELKTQLRKNE